jgi:pyridoxine 5-phosphate synthase
MNLCAGLGSPGIDLAVHLGAVLSMRAARSEPDPLEAALAAERGGADAVLLPLGTGPAKLSIAQAQSIAQVQCAPLDLELAFDATLIADAARIRPRRVYLTHPDPDASKDGVAARWVCADRQIGSATGALRAQGIELWLQIAADPDQIDAALETGAVGVQLDTSALRTAQSRAERDRILETIGARAQYALRSGLRVSAGRGLDRAAAEALAKATDIEELQIGHALAARGLFLGWESAVREIKASLIAARQSVRARRT